ncbi:hypothetical protein D3C81_1961660 [compost metagenome]
MMAANSGVRLAKKPATVGPTLCTPRPQQRKAMMAGPIATNISAATKDQLQSIYKSPSAHSPAVNTQDQATPKATCANRKAAQSLRICSGSFGSVSSQL